MANAVSETIASGLAYRPWQACDRKGLLRAQGCVESSINCTTFKISASSSLVMKWAKQNFVFFFTEFNYWWCSSVWSITILCVHVYLGIWRYCKEKCYLQAEWGRAVFSLPSNQSGSFPGLGFKTRMVSVFTSCLFLDNNFGSTFLQSMP